MTNAGSAAEWVGGIGAILGTAVVGGGLWWEIRQRRRADKIALDEKRDAEKADARLVSTVWTIYPNYCSVKVRNDSDGPVRSFSFGVRLPDAQDTEWSSRTAPGAFIVGAHSELQISAYFQVVLPRVVDDVAVLTEFTDRHGLRWRVVNDGQPERVTVE